MAITNPPYVLDSENHTAEGFRHMIRTMTRGAEGPLDAGDFAVAEAGTPDMTVDVAAGEALIIGTETVDQSSYLVAALSTTNLAITAADASLDRQDLVIAKVQDSEYSGATDAWALAVVDGTPAASPVDPAQPDNSILLARVNVAALAASIVNANIDDLRVFARMHGESADSSPADFTPSTTGAYETASTITFPDPGRPVYLEGIGAGTAETTSTDGRLKCNLLVSVSTDGGTVWTSNDASTDVDHSAIRRGAMSAVAAVGPVTPTGDLVVRLQYQQVSAPTSVTTALHDGSLMGSWKPA